MITMQSAALRARRIEQSRATRTRLAYGAQSRPGSVIFGNPLAELLIDPARAGEADGYVSDLFQAEKIARRRRDLAVGFTIGVVALLWWLLMSTSLDIPGEVLLGILASVSILGIVVGEHVIHMSHASMRSRRAAVQWQPWARSSLLLSSYLVTTHDPHRLWEAAGHQVARDDVQGAIADLYRYRAVDLLTSYREEQLQHYLERDDELRAKIVELCDPTPAEVR